MGKFDGVLLVSDYDDTLYSHNLRLIPEANRTAIACFLEQGGRFTIATGRARTTFLPQIEQEKLAFNAPVILSNGSAIYDFQADRPLYQSYLPDETAARMAQVCAVFPELGFESYHGEDIYVFRPNSVTREHLRRVAVPYTLCGSVAEMPLPWTKVILEQDHPMLTQAQELLLSRWGEQYEAIFSNDFLLELTAKENTKGALVRRVADGLGIAPEHVYCIGDNQNDISMLEAAAIGFAPANCAPEVRASGARILCHCDEGAVAQAIEILEDRYA